MKRLFILIILLLLLVSCTPIQAEPEPVIETVIVTETVIETVVEYVEVMNTDEVERLNNEIQKYDKLIDNLNKYSSYVYRIECTNDIGGTGSGTAFIIEYKQKIYAISSGHMVKNEHGIFSNFRIEVNNKWIHLELLDYNNDYNKKNDYAIFISSKLENGFDVDLDNDRPRFFIGKDESISGYSRKTEDGESGSPIIDIDGEVTELVTTGEYYYNTDISTVLKAINRIN